MAELNRTFLCCYIVAGEALTAKTARFLKSQVENACVIGNQYGPAETTVGCTYHLLDLTRDAATIPIGRPLSDYQCLVLDQLSQEVPTGSEGELVVGGVGVFAGYLRRDDQTQQVLIDIDGHIFYRTGDLVILDDAGVLHYRGRKDHQMKLRGQRIELGEIEQCVLRVSSTISTCVVTKWGDDHLVAYVQSPDVDEQQLRAHCHSRLPPHMVPSFIVIIQQLPLNANGKVDRKRLPAPELPSAVHRVHDGHVMEPTDNVEATVHGIWRDVLEREGRISIDTSIFAVGGHSLLLMQLLHRYRTQFGLEQGSLAIADLFQHPTIVEHAHLIHHALQLVMPDAGDCSWSPLHLSQGRRSSKNDRSSHCSHCL